MASTHSQATTPADVAVSIVFGLTATTIGAFTIYQGQRLWQRRRQGCNTGACGACELYVFAVQHMLITTSNIDVELGCNRTQGVSSSLSAGSEASEAAEEPIVMTA